MSSIDAAPNHPPAIADALARAQKTHARAAASLKDLAIGSVAAKVTALQMVVIYGVSTTHVLQNLRGVADAFDEWWLPWQARLKDDPLVRYLYDLRSLILKQGRDHTTYGAEIH